MKQSKRYTLLCVPESGLFYDGRRFHDGTGKKIRWGGTIRTFRSRKNALQRKAIGKKNGWRYVLLAFEPEKWK